MFIDLVQWLDPSSTGEAYALANHIGINHLALSVSDLYGTTAALRERGIAFLTGQVSWSDGADTFIVAFLSQDELSSELYALLLFPKFQFLLSTKPPSS